jgi:lipopolysaccharide export system ATP-binding protein
MHTLAADEISKSYRGRRVVNGVSIRVEQGEVVGLLGPNGAGKTTTFYTIVGLIPPDTGRVLIDNDDITGVPMYLRARQYRISYLPQEASVFRKLTVEENVLAVLEAQPISWHERREKMEKLIDQLGLEYIRQNRGYALSGGERRRVEIARALCINPTFILLDEPFSGIDPIAVLDLQKITDHSVRETLAVTDRAYIIDEGKIFASGKPDQLANNADVRRVYLGESFSLV